MVSVDFFLGLALGAGVYIWQQYHFRNQLEKITKLFSDQSDRKISLPPLSLIRRELYYLDRKRQELEQSKTNWQSLMEQAPIGYLVVDGDNQLIWCNQEAQSLLKIDRRRWGQVRLLLELVRSYELDRLIEKTRNTQQKQEKDWVFYFTPYALPKNSSEAMPSTLSSVVSSVTLRGSGFPLPNYQVGVFLVNLQPLVELSRSRDRTFSDLAHELKTPLTSISLVGENLLPRLKNPESRWVEQMLRETKRLINLVQEWLDISRLQDDPTRAMDYEVLDLSKLILSVWEILEPIAIKKQVTLDYVPTEAIIEGDKSRLIQVFLNLLDNAIKHSPQNGTITVELTLNNEQLIIDIIDSGSGFIESDLPYIFERLYRGDRSRTRNPDFVADGSLQGNGLGLAIVKQIVKFHGGSIKAQNHPKHGGAWMRITLPVKNNSKKSKF